MTMQRVARFEKVSRARFAADMAPLAGSEKKAEDMYEAIRLPRRATAGSAGYDFFLPLGITIGPGESIKIPTGVRVMIEEGFFMACFPRSGLGFKYRLQLNNTVGIIDSDYYGADNEGHIFCAITNDSREGKVLSLSAGEAFMQGIFMPYCLAYDDSAEGRRSGGLGSTSK